MKLRYSVRARDDLKTILAFIDVRNPAAARNVRRAIRSCAGLIGRYPELGTEAGELGTRVIAVGRYPYLIYWSVTDDAITIVHIRHTARERPVVLARAEGGFS